MLARRFAFVPGATSAAFTRASASISVDRLSERSATLVWTAPSPAPARYVVNYKSEGADIHSLRTVTHPFVVLHNLRPGLSYTASISTSTSFQTALTFTTPSATAGAPDAGAASTEVPEAPLTELSRLEIRVGRIVDIARHPDADTLYVEQVDVGEPEPRTIVSGLVKFASEDELRGRSVVVLCNLKPRAMRGVTSHGMLLCASNEDHTVVDPLAAPEDVPLGELVTFDGHRAAPIDPGNRATKAFDRIAEGLKTNDDGVAMFEDVPFTTSTGPCFSPGKLVGSIS